MTLRIAHLNSLLTGGGTDDQCIKLVRSLRQSGQRIWLAGPDGRDLSTTVRELEVPFRPTPPEGPLKLRFILSAAKLLRRDRTQIVHGHHGRDYWPTILAARLSGVRPRVLLTRHLAKSPASWVSRRFLLGRCDALIAVSHFVAKVLREGAYEPDSPVPERRARPPMQGDHSRIHMIHGGIDTARFRPFDAAAKRKEWNLTPEHLAFAVVGGYDLPRGKGQREFLQAAARISGKLPNARFLVLGRGNMKELLEADIARLGLGDKAWLLPYCQNMPAAMNAFDCLVHPQVGTEAFPGVVLEAFACGRPVIASSLDGIVEAFAIGQCGRLVPPEDIEALAAAMLEQAHEPALSAQARQTLHDRVDREHSLPRAAQKVADLYGQLFGAGHPDR